LERGVMDQAIGILGQAVLILVGLALVFFLVFAILLMIKGIRRLTRELRQPIMPDSDLIYPEYRGQPGSTRYYFYVD
jgi:hypothetical protein